MLQFLWLKSSVEHFITLKSAGKNPCEIICIIWNFFGAHTGYTAGKFYNKAWLSQNTSTASLRSITMVFPVNMYLFPSLPCNIYQILTLNYTGLPFNRTRIVTWYNLCSILRARLIFLKGVHRAYFCKSSAPFYTKSGARVVECSTEPNMAVVMIRNLTNDFEK